MLLLLLVLAICPVQIENRKLLKGSRSRPVNAPGCYVTAINYMLAFNETYSPKDDLSCEQYTCDYDGYTYITRCVDSFEGDCLKVQGNKSLTYPECCDFYDCSKSAKNFSMTTHGPNSDDALKQNTSIKNNEVSDGNNVETFSTISTENKNMPYSENATEVLARNSMKNLLKIVEEGLTNNITEKKNMSDFSIAVQNKNMSSVDIKKESSPKNTSDNNVDADSVITKEDLTTNITQNKNMTNSKNSTQVYSEKKKVTENIQKDKITQNSSSDHKQSGDNFSVNPEDVLKTELLNENSDTEDTSSSKSKDNAEDKKPSSVTVIDRNETETIKSLQRKKDENLMSIDSADEQSNKDKKSSGNDTKSTVKEKEK